MRIAGARLARFLGPFLIVIASLITVGVQVPQHAELSPVDEYVYVDYLAKIPSQFVVHQGEETGEFAREAVACRGVLNYPVYGGEMCERRPSTTDVDYPFAGLTSADLYTPLYFAATWVMAQPLVLSGVGLIDAARYTGVVWLALGGVLFYCLARQLKTGAVLATGLGVILVTSLPAYWSNTYLSTDATGFAAGALMMLLALLYVRRRVGAWALVVAAVVVSALKLQNVEAVAVAAVFLVIVALADVLSRPPDTRSRVAAILRDRRVLVAAAGMAVAIVTQAIWVVYRSATAVGPFPDQLVSEQFTASALLTEIVKFLGGASIGAITPEAMGNLPVVLAAVGVWTSVAGVIGAIVLHGVKTEEGAMARAALLVALLAGPALAVASILANGAYVALPARYGISMLPIFFACAAVLFRDRNWSGGVIGVTALSTTVLMTRV